MAGSGVTIGLVGSTLAAEVPPKAGVTFGTAEENILLASGVNLNGPSSEVTACV